MKLVSGCLHNEFWLHSRCNASGPERGTAGGRLQQPKPRFNQSLSSQSIRCPSRPEWVPVANRRWELRNSAVMWTRGAARRLLGLPPAHPQPATTGDGRDGKALPGCYGHDHRRSRLSDIATTKGIAAVITDVIPGTAKRSKAVRLVGLGNQRLT